MILTTEQKNNHIEGFIPLMRRIFDNPLWTEKRKFSRFEAWIDLLQMARYKEEKEVIIDRGEEIVLNEGDVLTSILSLSKRWRWSRTRVKKFISFLKQNGSLKCIRLDNRRAIFNIVRLGYFKRLIQQTEQQTLHQTGQQKCNRKTYTNKDNKGKHILSKDNIGQDQKKEKEFGNHLVNLILEEFKKNKGFNPTDKKPRQRAWNMVQKIETFIKKNKDRLPEVINSPEKIIEKFFSFIKKKDYFSQIETIDALTRKIEIFFGAVEKKIREREIIKKQEEIKRNQESRSVNQETIKKYEEAKKRFLEKFGSF